MLKVLAEKAASEEPAFGIDEICREGARRMLAVALEAEVDAYVAEHLEDRDDLGHRLVVRNGRAETRTVKTVAGAIEVTAPRVDDKRVDGESGERQRFHSSILLPWCRHSPQVSAVLPVSYTHLARCQSKRNNRFAVRIARQDLLVSVSVEMCIRDSA